MFRRIAVLVCGTLILPLPAAGSSPIRSDRPAHLASDMGMWSGTVSVTYRQTVQYVTDDQTSSTDDQWTSTYSISTGTIPTQGDPDSPESRFAATLTYDHERTDTTLYSDCTAETVTVAAGGGGTVLNLNGLVADSLVVNPDAFGPVHETFGPGDGDSCGVASGTQDASYVILRMSGASVPVTPDPDSGGLRAAGTVTDQWSDSAPGYSESYVETVDVDLTCPGACLPVAPPDGAVTFDWSSNSALGTRDVVFDPTGSSIPDGGSILWSFGDGTTEARATVAPFTHIYADEGEYDVTAALLCPACPASAGAEQVVIDPIRTYAPEVHLHPDEDWFPMDPGRFVDKSGLWWAHDAGCADDRVPLKLQCLL